MGEQPLAEEIAVDVWKDGEVRVQGFRAAIVGGVEHLKELGEESAEVGSVLAGAMLQEIGKCVPAGSKMPVSSAKRQKTEAD